MISLAVVKGMSIDFLALVAREFAFLGPTGLTIGETVFDRLPHREHCTYSRLKCIPSPVNEAYLLVLELWPEWQASCLQYSQGPM